MKLSRTNFAGRVGGPRLASHALAWGLFAAFGAQAQEALRSSLSYDQNVATNQNPVVTLTTDRPHLGPLLGSIGTYVAADYDDNINLVQTGAQADVLLHAGLTAGLDWAATPQTDLNLNTAIGYAHYLRYSQYDSLEIAPNSALAWTVYFDGGSVTFYDQFSYSQSPIAQAALAGTASFPLFNNTIGTRAVWEPGQWIWQAGYSHAITVAGTSSLDYLNDSSEYFYASGGWKFAENTQAGLEASASLTTYQLTSEGHNYSLSIGPFADWQITAATRATLRGGPTFYTFDAPGFAGQGSSVGSYYADLLLTQQLTSRISHQLDIQRNVSLGVNLGSSLLEQFTAGYSVNWAVTGRIGLSLGATYEHGTQTFQNLVTIFPGFNILETQSEVYDRYGLAPTLSWHATDQLSASLGYTYYLRQSSLDGRGYTQNDVSLRLTYSF